MRLLIIIWVDAYKHKKKNEEAKKLYDNAAKLEKDPVRLSSSYNNLGTIFQDEQNYEKAIEAYKSAYVVIQIIRMLAITLSYVT